MLINAERNTMHFKTLNNLIRNSKDAEVTIDNCIGQRFIGDEMCIRDSASIQRCEGFVNSFLKKSFVQFARFKNITCRKI